MPTEDAELQAVQLAALFHDVGKLLQRADPQPPAQYASFTPETYGAHGAHAMWSADFVERHVAPRWPVRPYDVLTHHLPVPASRVARLVAIADRMAAGERERDEDESGPSPWEAQLLAVLPRVRLEESEPRPEGYYPLAPLELRREVIFPREGRDAPDRCRQGYLGLARQLEAEFPRLQADGFDAFLEGAHHLIQRFGWCVPSAAFRQTPDVSLFDHSRLTCAIAACLHLDGLPDGDLAALLQWPPRGDVRRRPLLLLVGGDISGLQDFLYTVAARGAARTLRGRSFYLQLLAESAARFLLRWLGLGSPNLVYCGGGHLYLLAPAAVEPAMEAAAAQLESALLQIHGGDLSLAIGHVPLAFEDFEGGRFAQKWSEVAARIGERKHRRFGRVVGRSYEALFAPFGAGGIGGRCEACHAEVPGREQEEGLRCPTCRGMEALGNRLARAGGAGDDLLSVGAERPVSGGARWQHDLFQAFGLWWEFGPGAGSPLRYALNTTDFAGVGAHGFKWVPSLVPEAGRPGAEGVKEFDEIARDSAGIERLGVLRMDVDDLGAIFARGLGSLATVSRVAGLSSALRLFFEGWVNRLGQKVEADRSLVPPGVGARSGLLYGVYAGGDDLFVVGAWDRMPVLARRVRDDLAAYALGNPAVRISAGIALVDSHAPVYQAAEEAKRALEEGSKSYKRNGRAKDALTILGETLGWEELPPVWSQVEELVRLVSPGVQGQAPVPRSLLSLLGALHAMYRREAQRQAGSARPDPHRLYYGRWNWMSAYALGRARQRTRDDAAKAALAALEKRLSEPGPIRFLGLATRWAEFLTRNKEVQNR